MRRHIASPLSCGENVDGDNVNADINPQKHARIRMKGMF
jgi:hypothetical protein